LLSYQLKLDKNRGTLINEDIIDLNKNKEEHCWILFFCQICFF